MENLDIYGDLSVSGNSNHYGTVSAGASPEDYGSTSSLVQQVDEQMKSVINIGRGGSQHLVKVMTPTDMGEDDQDNVGGPMNLEQTSEKRIRREIANSNERRRMQSINAGFSSLRNLLPHHEGEKLSKAAILQQTAEYIYSLEQEKTRLLSQNCQLKRLLGQTQHVMETDEVDSGPAPKRRLIDTGQKLLFEEENEEIAEIQNKYERERRTRMQLEEKINNLMSQFGGGGGGIVTSRSGGMTDMSVAPVNLEKYPLDGRVEIIESVGGLGQTIITPGDKKGMETIIFQTTSGDKLPSIIQVKDGSKVEVEHLPRLPEFVSADGTAGTALEITSVQDPETGATRQYILTTQGDQVYSTLLPSNFSTGIPCRIYTFMGSDSGPSKNLETIVEAIRHLEGDHLFSEETGPHQVVKEEVVESTISLNEDSTMVEMTLPASITGQVQIPVSTLVSLPRVPVTFSLANSTSSLGTGTISSGKLNTNSLPMLPQVPVSISQLAGVTSIQQLDLKHFQPANILGTDPIELANIGPPQTSPVNLELATSGNITPTSEISTVSDSQGHLTNSPPQSSPVNLAQSQANDQ